MLNVGGPSTKILRIPSPHIGNDGAISIPLIAIGGALAATAAGANQALTVAAPAGTLGYLTDIWLLCTATAAVAASVSLLDASGGNVLDKITFNAAGPTLHSFYTKKFSIPFSTAAVAGQFFITTTGAGVTWNIQANGFYANIL